MYNVCHMCDYSLQCMECPPIESESWFSGLMVCDIGSRTATLMWRPEENATYIVLYEDNVGNRMRSDSVSV